ncbi:MAG: hypothetical protein RJA23_2010, partial [Bacteroidota bacterium]
MIEKVEICSFLSSAFVVFRGYDIVK